MGGIGPPSAEAGGWNSRRRSRPPGAYSGSAQASKAGILAPGGALLPLDVHALGRGCGEGCTEDGIHYANSTYE